jgi:hypothetical protein
MRAGGVSIRALGAASAGVVILWAGGVARAHGPPGHPNNATTILWEEDGVKDGNSNHSHLFDHSFVNHTDETNHLTYASDSAWHNRTLNTTAGKFGHGFIEEDVAQPRYKFVSNGTFVELTANMKTTVNDGFDLGETRAHLAGPALPGCRTHRLRQQPDKL